MMAPENQTLWCWPSSCPSEYETDEAPSTSRERVEIWRRRSAARSGELRLLSATGLHVYANA
ncbi:MAG: hypothetical protein JWN99_284 [Ilumatobacteraceae bacterium]|nr:hypothetical protein [Ilumatobacteraceae bacterium]